MSMQPSPTYAARSVALSRVHAAVTRAAFMLEALFRACSTARFSVLALLCAGTLAGCALPQHPDSAAPPTDPYNPAATQLLDDTHWQLSSWTDADGKSKSVPPADSPITLNFSTSNGQRRTSGFSGCNRFTGTYDLNSGKLSFGPLATTRMACAPGAGASLEPAFLQGLASIEKTGVQMHPPIQLQITLKNGDVMMFAQQSASKS
jgi:heat shock protein HslJ